MNMEDAWDAIASYFRTGGDECIHYGPWSPPESELRLLGDLRKRRVLELGCGGGECSVAFAAAGAQVTALDLSTVQLTAARRLAGQKSVRVDFVHGSAEDLHIFSAHRFDLLFANHVLPYVADLPRAFAEFARVLTPGGSLVFSLDHPVRNLFFDEEDAEMVIYPTRSYFDERPIDWTFGGPETPMRSHHRTVGGWIALIRSAGLLLGRVVEPRPPVDLLDRLWPEDGPLAALRNVPQTVIFVAHKPVVRVESERGS